MSYTVYVAGTFNVLTEGHKRLLKIAIKEMEEFRHLKVYVTDDEFYYRNKKVPVRDFERRCNDVRRFLVKECGLDDDQFDILSLRPETKILWWAATDVLVCSTETMVNAMKLWENIWPNVRPRLAILERDPAMQSSTDIIKASLKRKKMEVIKW